MKTTRETETGKYQDRRRHQPHPRKYNHGRRNVQQWIREQWQEENIQAFIGSLGAFIVLAVLNYAALVLFHSI